MTIDLKRRRRGHVSTKVLAKRFDKFEHYETEYTNFKEMQRVIKARFVFDYINPLHPRECEHPCVAVRVRKPSLSFDRVAVLSAKTYYDLVLAGCPPKFHSNNNDDVLVTLRYPKGDGETGFKQLPVIRAIVDADPWKWYSAAWSTYCLLPSTWFARDFGKQAKTNGPLANPHDLIRSHKIIAEMTRTNLFVGATDISKYLVEPSKCNLTEFYTLKTRGA